MLYPYDLHTHTFFSDGDYSPKALFKKAKKLGMRNIIITDHNVINHFKEMAAAAKHFGFKPIQGIEISANFKKIDIHILGYSLNFKEKILFHGLKKVTEGTYDRLKLMIKKLKQAGINLDFNTLKKERGEKFVFKKDLVKKTAKLIKKPYYETSKMFERGGQFYVPYSKKIISPKKAIELIVRAGGLPVIAHPLAFKRSSHNYKKTKKIIIKLIKDLIRQGLKGIEIRSSHHNLDNQKEIESFAKKYKLIITGGSDYHGKISSPNKKIGGAGIKEKEYQKFLKAIESIK